MDKATKVFTKYAYGEGSPTMDPVINLFGKLKGEGVEAASKAKKAIKATNPKVMLAAGAVGLGTGAVLSKILKD